jgi:pyrroline-5-carboxylate reductase
MSDNGLRVRLALIGGGKMGEALLGGLLRRGWCSVDEVVVIEPDEGRRTALGQLFAGVATRSEATDMKADGVLIAVKPQHVPEVCAAISGKVNRVLSIAAGVTTTNIEAWLDDPTIAVVRSMPNTPALVGFGASAIAAGASAGPKDLDWAEEILASVGVVERVTESQLDAVTGLSGSGPAYVFLVAEAMIEAGVLAGLSRATATTLAVQTIRGAGEMLAESGKDAATLRGDVTSPGGTTAAGLRALESRAVRAAFNDAVVAATERSRELGR